MRKTTVLLFLFLCSTCAAFAVDGKEVRLASSTIPGATGDAVGEFDITRPDALVFHAKGSADIVMPYAGVTEYAYRTELTHHLGVAGTIVVGIVKKRQRGHFLIVTWKDDKGVMQMSEFEISKQMPKPMLALLQAKSPKAHAPAPQYDPVISSH